MTQVLKVNDDIFDRLVDHHVDTLRLSQGAADEVITRLMQCDRDTCAYLIEQASEDGKLRHRHIERMLRRCEDINDVCYIDIGKFLADELRDLSVFEASHAVSVINNALQQTGYRVKNVKRAQLRAIVDEEPMTGGLFWEWVAGLADGRFQRLRAQLRMGIAVQDTAFQIARRIRGTRPLNYRDGIAAVSMRSLRSLVTTSYNHIVNKSRLDVFKANDIVVGYQWSAVLDDVTCDECADLDGNVFDPDEIDENPVPSLHLNCRCLMTPIIGNPDDDYEFPRPQRLTYEQWLTNQKASRQDDILGPTRAAMFRRGMPLKKFTDSSGVRYNLSELRKIEAKTMAKTAARPSSKLKVLKNFGWKPDLPDQRDLLFAVENPEAVQIPVKTSLRAKMPPVFDQGNLGSCVANALVADHMFMHKGEVMLSRLALYYHARLIEGTEGEDSGCMIRDGIKALRTVGDCTEKSWPYQIRKFAMDPPARTDAEALTYKITSYQRLKGHDDYLKCLTRGRPFTFGFSVYSNMYDQACEKYGILPVPPKTAQMLGGHAVVAVGFDQDFHNSDVFKKSGLRPTDIGNFVYEIRNSWGADWGDAGYFWMDARILENTDLSDDFWVIFS